ncbi:hypothetical protein PN441_12060 [Spirulina major CS-329]|uniref:hypothetical protein n=1 Tax=Spirulina TaxID=1154 RepID=UPI00232EA7E2|nr:MULTISPECIES: hypothetical protein [Spirulina]MDB9496633.1 hypothetical protein [Spirulina subsalsa CS-330]MDB9503808.1 hypothetical protein [Spirulina major CS-329]
MISWNNVILGTVVSGLVITQAAHAQLQQPIQLAQENLTGQCRQVKQNSPIYEMRGSSDAIRTLPQGTRVLLDEPGVIAERIYITLPNVISGFIDPNNLTDCGLDLSDTPTAAPQSTPPDNNSICINSRVSSTEGLTIWSLPSSSPEVPKVDRVYPAERISIIGEPFFNQQTGTEWLQITHPLSGWIENGVPNTAQVNTSPCNSL